MRLRLIKNKVIRSVWLDISIMTMALIAVMMMMSSCHARRIINQESVFNTPFGETLCAELEYTECGVSLRNCADGFVYSCLQNVRFEQKD